MVADSVEHCSGAALEEAPFGQAGQSQPGRGRWVVKLLDMLATMSVFYLWVWLWIILSLVVFPLALPSVKFRAPWLATLLAIVYPLMASSIMSKGIKVLMSRFMTESVSKMELHYASIMASSITAEFMCKVPAYSADTLGETVGILFGQMISEVLSRWLMPHMVAAKVACQEYLRDLISNRQKDGARWSYNVVTSLLVGDVADSELATSTESHVSRERSLQEATVLASCSMEARNCMEYVAHCGVVITRYVGGDGMQGWHLAQAWLLAVGLEILSDMMFAFGKRWLNLKGTGRYPLPLNFKTIGFIVSFSAENAFMCMVQKYCVLEW
mmetsp:Transcript_46664/g.141609  ORF Transcript_46664/g.141609 Transcript_46664/m.141609 type:complete len:327 (-) Transcript_46664:410-1390(-)